MLATQGQNHLFAHVSSLGFGCAVKVYFCYFFKNDPCLLQQLHGACVETV